MSFMGITLSGIICIKMYLGVENLISFNII